MSKRMEKWDEFQHHARSADQFTGEMLAYAGMAGFAIINLVVSIYHRKKESKAADEIYNSDLKDHLWLDNDEESEEE